MPILCCCRRPHAARPTAATDSASTLCEVRTRSAVRPAGMPCSLPLRRRRASDFSCTAASLERPARRNTSHAKLPSVKVERSTHSHFPPSFRHSARPGIAAVARANTPCARQAPHGENALGCRSPAPRFGIGGFLLSLLACCRPRPWRPRTVRDPLLAQTCGDPFICPI